MRKKCDIKNLQEFAENKNGNCLETIYIGNKYKMLWECKEKHQWEAAWGDIKNNHWCPYCAKVVKPDITELQEFAKNKNGALLSTEYINSDTKMLWKCKEGHQWEARWDNIKNAGQWCPICSGKIKAEIKELQLFAKNKNGRLISTEYINNNTKLLWECSEGHQWKARWNNIKNLNQWCPTCSGCSKPDITELQDYALSKNGSLLSNTYINDNTKMVWGCEKGHQWEAIWDNIKNNHWCPECSSFKTEHRCKKLLEQKLGYKFKKTRFIYKGNRYEFDGYSAENKVAFEYQGIQHYIYPNHWHRTLEIHEKAVQRDLDKINYVKENNIKLIIIPYTEEKNLEDYITKQIDILDIGI
jgi:hypothetical protein